MELTEFTENEKLSALELACRGRLPRFTIMALTEWAIDYRDLVATYMDCLCIHTGNGS